MGFNPQIAVFFSGIGTLIFIAVTGGRVPSYLGSSFSYIGPVLAVVTVSGAVDAGRIPLALGGIAASALLYGLAALATIRWGAGWARVDFSQPRNLIVAGVSVTLATGLGVQGLTVRGVGVSGIALGTLLALVLNAILRVRADAVSADTVSR